MTWYNLKLWSAPGINWRVNFKVSGVLSGLLFQHFPNMLICRMKRVCRVDEHFLWRGPTCKMHEAVHSAGEDTKTLVSIDWHWTFLFYVDQQGQSWNSLCGTWYVIYKAINNDINNKCWYERYGFSVVIRFCVIFFRFMRISHHTWKTQTST